MARPCEPAGTERGKRHKGKSQPREVLQSRGATVSAPKLSDFGVSKTQSSRHRELRLALLDDARALAQLDEVVGVEAGGFAISSTSDEQVDGTGEHFVVVMLV
jgi:hypothetical protein